MKTRNLYTIVRLVLLVALTQSLVMAQPFCEGGGWFCVINTAETSGCCPDSNPDDTTLQFCHPPAPVSQSEADCLTCPTCNFEAETGQNATQAAVPANVTIDEDLLSASVSIIIESHSDDDGHLFADQKYLSHAPPALLYVMHQSFLN